MFFRFIGRRLQYRKQRLLVAFAALAVAATLATVLFGIYGTVARRLHDEFRAYGANIVAVPANEGTLPLEIVAAAEKQGAAAAPYLITTTGGMVVAGFEPAKTKLLTPYWNVRGDCLAGEDTGLRVGQAAPAVPSCVVQGILKTGGPEDRELFVPFATAERIAGLTNSASVIEIRAPGERVDAIRSALAAAYPIARFRTVRSVADTENLVIMKIRAALFLLTLLILTITTLCVSSNFTEMVIERSKEIGILKALGAAERRIASFFVSESAALALAATLTGYVAGVFATAAIGRQIFGGVFHPESSWFVFLVVTAVMLSVAAIATAIATSRIWNIEAAVILRGE
jgi:putative ABC transport system permease protein